MTFVFCVCKQNTHYVMSCIELPAHTSFHMNNLFNYFQTLVYDIMLLCFMFKHCFITSCCHVLCSNTGLWHHVAMFYFQTLVYDIMLLCFIFKHWLMTSCCYVLCSNTGLWHHVAMLLCSNTGYDIMLLCFRKEHIKTMSNRILFMREQLHQKLKAIGCPGNWDHIVLQKGMFSYTGLNG